MSLFGICPGIGAEPKSVSTVVCRDLVVSTIALGALCCGGLGFATIYIPQISAIASTQMFYITAITTIVAGAYLILQSYISFCKKVTHCTEALRNFSQKIGFFVGILFISMGVGALALATGRNPDFSTFLFPAHFITSALTTLSALLILGLECRCGVKKERIKAKPPLTFSEDLKRTLQRRSHLST